MVTTAFLAAALMSQATPGLAFDAAPQNRTDVAYESLSRGDAQTALRKLEATEGAQSGDPATLINLAAAYIATGQTHRAIASYKAAIASRERYDLELADGSWADSRTVARQGLARLMVAMAAR